jgi:hypothetical protein
MQYSLGVCCECVVYLVRLMITAKYQNTCCRTALLLSCMVVSEAEGTPTKLANATAVSENCYQSEWTHVTEWSSAYWGTADSRKPRGNAVMRRLVCSVAWKLSFSALPQVALPFPQFALLHSVTCAQLRLITILRICGCVAVVGFLGVPSAWEFVHWLNKTTYESAGC